MASESQLQVKDLAQVPVLDTHMGVPICNQVNEITVRSPFKSIFVFRFKYTELHLRDPKPTPSKFSDSNFIKLEGIKR